MNSDDHCGADTSIRQKIKTARELFQLWGSSLQGDPAIRGLAERLERKIAGSRKAMLDSGIVAACRDCEEKDGGSCCGAGIENKYDPFLLTLNLLMGAYLPDGRSLATPREPRVQAVGRRPPRAARTRSRGQLQAGQAPAYSRRRQLPPIK